MMKMIIKKKKMKKKKMMIAKKKFVLVVVLALAAMLIFTGCGVDGEQGSPEKVVESYFKAFKNKDFQTAINYTTGGETLSEQDIANLATILEHLQIKKYEVGKAEKLTNDEAIVPVTITTVYDGDENVAKDDVRVVRIDGKWFIDESIAGSDDDWDDREPPQPTPDFEEMEMELELEDLEDFIDQDEEIEEIESELEPEVEAP